MKKLTLILMGVMALMSVQAQNLLTFQKWAKTPPMGWNSWDCYGPTVTEDEVKANADYMAKHLLEYGWEYVIVDIRWYVENDKAGGYNQTNPIYVYDQWGRYTPALNRFPSAANGVGFKQLADYCHSKGLKFGIHLMRGLPKVAAQKKLPVKGTDGITCDMICNNDSACTWLRDNYKVDCTKPGAQEYYNSCFDMYADWGVDFVKIDDLSRPYHTGEIEMIRHAIDRCGRPIVLSLSPGETPVDQARHAQNHANMWRTVDDFWDNWSQLTYQFGVCARWAPYIGEGHWPDADMLPLGRLSIRGERGAERWSNFTEDEQYTLMNLWTIFKSPLFFGGNLPDNNRSDNPINTNALLTNKDVLKMHHFSQDNKQLSNQDGKIIWTAVDPSNYDKYVALFNNGGLDFVNTRDALWRSGTISYLTTGHQTSVKKHIPDGSTTLALVVTDGGDGFDCDHADWINPELVLEDESIVKLTDLPIQRYTMGWGNLGINKNINGGKLSVNGVEYDNGFAVHANSILLFEIPYNAVEFRAIAGIDNTGSDQGSKSSVEFMVFNYDPTIRDEWTDQWTGGNKQVLIDPAKQAACSGYISKDLGVQKRQVIADITGAEKLYLVVTNGGDDFSYDHADWINPVLIDSDNQETSLTTIAWDANPINGWNNPQLNKSNDGNALTIEGKKYDKGFGCNSPSVLTFTLPANHKFKSFRSIVGYDDEVKDAPKGVTMEFRVFTEDPTPVLEQEVTLDFTSIGFASDKTKTLTDMWTGEKTSMVGDKYSVLLKNHASKLVRVSVSDRKSSKVNIVGCSVPVSGDVYLDVEVSISGTNTGGYVQAYCDGKLAGTAWNGNGRCIVICNDIPEGEHEFYVTYSGTEKFAPSKSETLRYKVNGIQDTAASQQGLSLKVLPGAVAIDAEESVCLNVYTISGMLVRSVELKPGQNQIALSPGTYILAGQIVLIS